MNTLHDFLDRKFLPIALTVQQSGSNFCKGSILLKNSGRLGSDWPGGICQHGRAWPSPPHVAKIGAGRGMSFASFLRFWAVAANRNSSLAPLGPMSKRRYP